MAQEFPSIPFAANLLKSMMDNPLLHRGEPSTDVLGMWTLMTPVSKKTTPMLAGAISNSQVALSPGDVF